MNAVLSVSTDADREALADLHSHAFGFPREDAPPWFDRAGHANVLAFRDNGLLAGGLISVPMGQHFGGRSVPMVGVAGVAVAPEHRGTGAATRMMHAFLTEMHTREVPLSTLYPATVPLYQRAGYERAGGRYLVTVRPQDLPSGWPSGLRPVPLSSVGDGETLALFRRQAKLRPGSLDRGPYVWSRVNRPYKTSPRFVGLAGDEGLEGYAVLVHRTEDGHDTSLAVVDAVAVTPRAVDGLLALFASYRSLAGEVRWFCAPQDALTQRLRDRQHKIELTDLWMLRVLHVERALALRGYNPFVRGELSLSIDDELLPANRGGYRLSVSDGAATVSREEPPQGLCLDVRGLAALYTGFRSASALVADGLGTGDERSIALADALFAGPAPALSEMF